MREQERSEEERRDRDKGRLVWMLTAWIQDKPTIHQGVCLWLLVKARMCVFVCVCQKGQKKRILAGHQLFFHWANWHTLPTVQNTTCFVFRYHCRNTVCAQNGLFLRGSQGLWVFSVFEQRRREVKEMQRGGKTTWAGSLHLPSLLSQRIHTHVHVYTHSAEIEFSDAGDFYMTCVYVSVCACGWLQAEWGILGEGSS